MRWKKPCRIWSDLSGESPWIQWRLVKILKIFSSLNFSHIHELIQSENILTDSDSNTEEVNGWVNIGVILGWVGNVLGSIIDWVGLDLLYYWVAGNL